MKAKKYKMKKGVVAQLIYMLVLVGIAVVVGLFFMNFVNKNKKNVDNVKTTDKIVIIDKDGNGRYLSLKINEKYGTEVKVITPDALDGTEATDGYVVDGYLTDIEKTGTIIEFVDVNDAEIVKRLFRFIEGVNTESGAGNYSALNSEGDEGEIIEEDFKGVVLGKSFKVKNEGNCIVGNKDDCVVATSGNKIFILVNKSDSNQKDKMADVVFDLFLSK